MTYNIYSQSRDKLILHANTHILQYESKGLKEKLILSITFHNKDITSHYTVVGFHGLYNEDPYYWMTSVL